MKQIQVRSKNVLVAPGTARHVVNEPSHPIQYGQQSAVIKISAQQQKGNVPTMKLNHLLIVIVVVGVALGFAMFGAVGHMIDATPHIQQTAQTEIEWAGRVAIAEIEASVAKETNMVYNAFRMFHGAATYGVTLLVLVVLAGGFLLPRGDGR